MIWYVVMPRGGSRSSDCDPYLEDLYAPMYDDCPMSQFRYRMVTVGVDRLVERLNSLGKAGWRLVTAAPAGDVWPALLEQRLDSPRQRTAPPRARVEVRIGGETVEKVAMRMGCR
ncbi:hypothetical protein AB1484_24240 [Parafrankia sp. FMc6]|uniref:hypothetical protein n=1 Tax=Parafrankia soli TaxID=2599596 RepID=UPI0034D4C421